MPGQTETLKWNVQREGIVPFYCTDFCSALHQEMQGYIRVSAANKSVTAAWSLDGEIYSLRFYLIQKNEKPSKNSNHSGNNLICLSILYADVAYYPYCTSIP
jgi:heme/copper-type cytochrome/quinol oxidase subunit 2